MIDLFNDTLSLKEREKAVNIADRIKRGDCGELLYSLNEQGFIDKLIICHLYAYYKHNAMANFTRVCDDIIDHVPAKYCDSKTELLYDFTVLLLFIFK